MYPAVKFDPAATGWELLYSELDKSRFCEYTKPEFREKFFNLSNSSVEELKTMPSLFMYEGDEISARIGYLTNIKDRGPKSILIEYEFDLEIMPLPPKAIVQLKLFLDIGDFELSRTHWAIKDEDLLRRLCKAGYIPQNKQNPNPPHLKPAQIIKPFDVAFSFAGEDRGYVEKVASILTNRGVRVFYDRFEQASLWGKNLYEYLSDIYQHKAYFSLMFISKNYLEKNWTTVERHAMQARLLKDNDGYVLPARFDNTQIPGLLPTTGYIDLAQLSPDALADIVVKKLELERGL